MKELIMEMERYSVEENIPLIEKDAITFLMKYVNKHGIKNILEIGSGIGYSAILLATAMGEDGHISTIEKDETRYMECLKNVKKCELEKRINVVFQDALELNLTGVEYDLIFIDASKGKFIDYFEKFKHFLSESGVIITDNLKFHGMAGNKNKLDKKNIESLVEKIESYINFLKDNEDFTTKFYDIGDGLSVSVKKGNEELIK